MSLRITQGMMHTQLMRDLNRNLGRMQKLQEQMNSGMKINRPSDDPVGITYGLRYRSELSTNDQYQKNVSMANSWLEFSDKMLTQTEAVFHRLKELTIKASTGSNPQAALDAIRVEVEELRDQLIDIGNSKLNGKYVFNGQFTDEAPYTAGNAADDRTDSSRIPLVLGAGVEVTINISGNDIFGEPGTDDNAFKLVDDLITALQDGDFAGISASLDKQEQRMDKVLAMHAEIGARTNRVELIENRLKDLGLNLEAMQSKVEDADYGDLIIKSKINESIYNASLSVGAKIITPSLVDFLR
ncbi:flagellar hook-associated protein FlgL [Paenibacillus sp. J2TS4]|uniref:flagellar hook-associated protein FlgL n=1 Tax=Paenibacillus sp. J2TS4 TaxID=2807194 RepID=UPI001B0A78E7|nr:flagellar hook-associated protein FlgL [Paenibacillus sp. J2TS4]GIP35597.1 flagellar hook-associated protein FlgL [Paenibacillus sp. J2TS4]